MNDARLRDGRTKSTAEKRVSTSHQIAATVQRYVIWMDGDRKYDVTGHGASYKSAPEKDESPLIAWVRQLVKNLYFYATNT
jgi:hypothetical protein